MSCLPCDITRAAHLAGDCDRCCAFSFGQTSRDSDAKEGQLACCPSSVRSGRAVMCIAPSGRRQLQQEIVRLARPARVSDRDLIARDEWCRSVSPNHGNRNVKAARFPRCVYRLPAWDKYIFRTTTRPPSRREYHSARHSLWSEMRRSASSPSPRTES